MNKITQMLQLQQTLNDDTNGINWENGTTKHGKIIDWRRCIYLECAELIESYPWKHWKNIDATPDYANIKIEVVDIWHFVLSLGLQEYKIHHQGSIENLSQKLTALPNFKLFCGEITPNDKDYYKNIKTVEKLIQTLFCTQDIDILFEAFIDVAIQSQLNLEALYRLYVGKNILNQFRQDHGYKEGTYIKVWNGEEDNVVMSRILDQNSDITPDELYERLKELYSLP